MRRVLTAALLGLGLLAPATAHAARAWSSPQWAQSGDGVPMVAPSSAFTSSGELVAAWSADRPHPGWLLGDGGIGARALPMRVAIRRAGGGAFGPAQVLDDDAMATARVVADGVGGAVVAWIDSSNALNVSRRPPGGAFEPARYVTHADSFDLDTNARGDAALVYRDTSGVPGMAFRNAGGEFGPARSFGYNTPISPRAAPDVGVTPNGYAVAVWQHDSNGQSYAFESHRAPDKTFSFPHNLSNAGRHGLRPQVAIGPQGHVTAAWTQATSPYGPGYVTTQRMNPECCNQPAEPTSLSTTWEGAGIVPAEGSAAVVYAFDLNRALASKRTHPYGLSVLGMDMQGGSTTRPFRIYPSSVHSQQVTSNARGDVLAAIGYGGVVVSRRAPGGAFGPAGGVYCAESRLDSIALAPNGDAAVFSTPSGEMPWLPRSQLIEDREAAMGTPSCLPAGTRKPERVGGRLALQARLPRGGRLRRGRSLEVRAFCGIACNLRARGTVRVGRGRTVRGLALTKARRSRAGTSTLHVTLARKHRKAILRALRRGRPVRARLTVRAIGANGERSLNFRVRLRRR